MNNDRPLIKAKDACKHPKANCSASVLSLNLSIMTLEVPIFT